MGILKVEGEENAKVFGGKISEGVYNPVIVETSIPQTTEDAAPVAEMSLAQKMERGKQVYTQNCLACHQATGAGIPNAFPPLAKSDYLNNDVHRAIEVVKFGLTGAIEVNGNVYNSAMPKQNISDEDVAAVLTYVYNNWDNNKAEVSTDMVKKVK